MKDPGRDHSLMGGAIISESGGGIIPLRGATSSRNWGAASSGISTNGPSLGLLLSRWLGAAPRLRVCHSVRSTPRHMTRIEISAAAHAALAASATRGLVEPRRSPLGGYSIWLTTKALKRLEAVRRPYESYSVAILRLAKTENVIAT